VRLLSGDTNFRKDDETTGLAAFIFEEYEPIMLRTKEQMIDRALLLEEVLADRGEMDFRNLT